MKRGYRLAAQRLVLEGVNQKAICCRGACPAVWLHVGHHEGGLGADPRVGEWRFMVGFEFAVAESGSVDRCPPGVGTPPHTGSNGKLRREN